MLADSDYDAGMSRRRQVLGRNHVAQAEADKTPFDSRFQQYITESAWGAVWSDPTIDLRTRSLLTIALLAALGHEKELAMHVRATGQTGVTAEEVREALMHVAVYAGVPAANRAFAIAKRALAEAAAVGGSQKLE